MNKYCLINKKAEIMVVDDSRENIDQLASMLQNIGYIPRPVTNGREAIESAKQNPPDLILLDIMMPEMSGFEVCQKLKEDKDMQDIPVIFISALEDTLDKLKAFSIGGVDYVTKPFHFQEIKARITTHLNIAQLRLKMEDYNHRLEELVQQQVNELFEAQMATIFAIVKLSESRDDDTGKHLERVQNICQIIAINLAGRSRYNSQINESFIDNIYHSSPLHDIGKVAIPDYILLKPDKHTPEEFEIVKTHTILGAKTLETVHYQYQKNKFLKMGIDIALNHHEKWDGSGYLSGISGENIPLSARIMAVADVYDALRSKRCYKEAFSHKKSHSLIIQGIGTHFDPVVVAAFHNIHEKIKNIYEALQEC